MTERSSMRIMLAVWKALFVREASVRLFGSRAAWVWIFFEPLFHVAFLAFLFGVIRQTEISGMDVIIFLVLGLFGFFVFRRTTNQMGGAISANRALFTYRQVVPFDPIIVRGFLETMILMAIFCITLLALALLEYQVLPENPMSMMLAFFSLWLLGTGLGLVVAVSGEIVPETRTVFKMLMLPLYIISGIIFPISVIPPEYIPIFLLNPIPHGAESIRMAFSDTYGSVLGIRLSYILTWAVGFWAAGLILYRSFAHRVIAE